MQLRISSLKQPGLQSFSLRMEAIDVLLEKWKQNGLSEAEVANKFSKCTLYVTCEPCIMCAAALSILGMLILVHVMKQALANIHIIP
ncbi:hypothetical protein CsSME_00048463 [Camellia sinensis var. sinensis]